MQSSIKKFMAVGAALVAGANSQNFRVVGEVYNGTPGSTIKYRTWYGDGNVYVGPHIPEGIQNALNFTSKFPVALGYPGLSSQRI